MVLQELSISLAILLAFMTTTYEVSSPYYGAFHLVLDRRRLRQFALVVLIGFVCTLVLNVYATLTTL